MQSPGRLTALLLGVGLLQMAVLPALPGSPSIDLIAAVLAVAAVTMSFTSLVVPLVIAGLFIDAAIGVSPLGITVLALLLFVGMIVVATRYIQFGAGIWPSVVIVSISLFVMMVLQRFGIAIATTSDPGLVDGERFVLTTLAALSLLFISQR